jgi:broad specificity phosphatase PhoE
MGLNPSEILMFVARHGTTVLNQNGCFRGPLDPDLDKKGWADANTLKYYFDPIDLGSIFFSPKMRSRHTAMLINRGRVDIPYYGNENLQALNVGHLGGQKKTPETEEEVRYHLEHPDEPFDGGESFNEFKSRVRPLLVDGIKMALKYGKPTLLVAHSSIVHETGELFNGDHSSTLVTPGGVAAVYCQDGELKAAPIFKPDLERVGHQRAEVIT